MSSTENARGDIDLQKRLAKQIKILEIEKKMAGRRGFWKGLAVGFLLNVLLLVGTGIFVWQNKEEALELIASHFLLNYAESLFSGFPDAYMTIRGERVLEVLDQFTNAMQYQRVTRDDFNDIARQAFSALQDQRLTYQELDELLDRLERASQPAP
jgi:hypothetical protein